MFAKKRRVQNVYRGQNDSMDINVSQAASFTIQSMERHYLDRLNDVIDDYNELLAHYTELRDVCMKLPAATRRNNNSSSTNRSSPIPAPPPPPPMPPARPSFSSSGSTPSSPAPPPPAPPPRRNAAPRPPPPPPPASSSSGSSGTLVDALRNRFRQMRAADPTRFDYNAIQSTGGASRRRRKKN
jgi:hypothetical protein